ncbi:YopX family protein [Enterococcus gallinarum]|uniref:YopX family protein n=1 Tax=Enterococcus TaxID=1350 RepID=UPI003BF8A47F
MVPKFRAWDKENDRMIYPSTEGVCFELDEDGINILDVSGDYPEDHAFPAIDSVLMQSTGLKDKNGVEIFEADVVKVSDGGNEEDSYTSVVKNYADEGYPAFDIEAPSSWYYESNVLSTIMGGDYETIEVIGNIWENPNLLEQTYEN